MDSIHLFAPCHGPHRCKRLDPFFPNEKVGDVTIPCGSRLGRGRVAGGGERIVFLL